MHTYPIPWDAINVSTALRAAYHELMNEPLNPEFAYTGASTTIFNQLPRMLPRANSAAAASIFFLPLSPWALCFVSDPEMRRMVKVDWHPGLQRKPTPIERIMDVARISSRPRIRTAGTYPRTATFYRMTHTCAAYERAVQWTLNQPSWQRMPERHVWVYEFPHYLRAAILTEHRMRGCVESLNAKMAMGILLAQEDRLRDWREERAQGKLILIPFYSPPFFEFDAAARIDSYKKVVAAESSGDGVACHRFDRDPRQLKGLFLCSDEAMRNPNGLRIAVKFAVAGLANGSILSPPSRFAHYTTTFLHRKAALYNRSTFCIVPPGDSVVTPRISSFIAAACIPVFTFSRDYLPFQQIMPWANMSLAVSPADLLRYRYPPNNTASGLAKGGGSAVRNPLAFLLEMPRKEVRRMQRTLLKARHHFLYRHEAPSAVHSIAHELQAACRPRNDGVELKRLSVCPK